MVVLKKLPIVVLISFLLFSCSTENIDNNFEPLVEEVVAPTTKTIESEILYLINKHRQSLGLNTLGNPEIIKSVAYSHTEYMVNKNEISHDNFPTRSSYLKENAGAKKVAENVAYGHTSAESVVKAWIKSEGHKQNIEGDFSDFNIAAEKGANGKWFYTNIFIKK
ncbi:CAP domain-containing protein [Oceanihabitans sp. IOP_32]|uniref:CAP domain-containing protein n=1 Tax=Oceanihabitans sp. IOP_32 TaxID=2529032 RepID=UPI001293B9FA|nr:CAP domain-containing protein [Oceanihabitans sp. IOP_32]QFZ55585.1 CAP domain-containing protein [Oceanihabitans sp. IOP_32]